MHITVSGDIGSGKSTIGKMLAEHYGYKFIDGGQLYRDMAKEIGLDVLEQNRSDDYSIDRAIDTKLAELGKTDDFSVVVSRTAWCLMPESVKIYLTINPVLAAKRLLTRKSNNEEHKSVEDILEYSSERIVREDIRYGNMYGVTREQQLTQSNIILHVGNRSIDEVFDTLVRFIDINCKHVLIFDPATVLPTRLPQTICMPLLKEYEKYFKGDIIGSSCYMTYSKSAVFINDGHHRIAAACRNGVKFVYTVNSTIDLCARGNLTTGAYLKWASMCGCKIDNEMEALQHYE